MYKKGLLTKLGEVLDQHFAKRQVDRQTNKELLTVPQRSWLPTHGNVIFTLLVIGSLLWVQNSGVITLGAPMTATTSTTGIPYQGRLADKNGTPLTQTVNMIFRLYAAASGGSPLWEEQWTGANSVQVSDGLFNVMLGSLTPIPQSVITGNSNLFLGITVGTDSEMSPRVQLGSVPFATQALTVPDGSITKAKLAPDVSLLPPDGSITTAKLADGAVTQEKSPFAPRVYREKNGGEFVNSPIIYTRWFFGNNVGSESYNLSNIFSEIDSVMVTRSRSPGGTNQQITFMVTNNSGNSAPIPSEIKVWAYDVNGNLASWIEGYVTIIGR